MSQSTAHDPATLADRSIHIIALRNSQIQDTRKQGLVSDVIEPALKNGVSADVGEGSNNWSAAHVSDTAHLYWLALERCKAGARYHRLPKERSASAESPRLSERHLYPSAEGRLVWQLIDRS